MDAWLITWELLTEPEPKRVLGLLPATFSPEEVARFVEATYAHRHYTLSEQAVMFADPGRNPYPARVAETAPGYHRIACGHHPFLAARLVRRLAAAGYQGEQEAVDVITWDECTASGAWQSRTLTQSRVSPGSPDDRIADEDADAV